MGGSERRHPTRSGRRPVRYHAPWPNRVGVGADRVFGGNRGRNPTPISSNEPRWTRSVTSGPKPGPGRGGPSGRTRPAPPTCHRFRDPLEHSTGAAAEPRPARPTRHTQDRTLREDPPRHPLRAISSRDPPENSTGAAAEPRPARPTRHTRGRTLREDRPGTPYVPRFRNPATDPHHCSDRAETSEADPPTHHAEPLRAYPTRPLTDHRCGARRPPAPQHRPSRHPQVDPVRKAGTGEWCARGGPLTAPGLAQPVNGGVAAVQPGERSSGA